MKSVVEKIRLILTIQCEEASRLASDSLDRRLDIHERLALRGHQFVCWSCRQFEKHLHVMRQTLSHGRKQQAEELDAGPELSNDVKNRLKKLL